MSVPAAADDVPLQSAGEGRVSELGLMDRSAVEFVLRCCGFDIGADIANLDARLAGGLARHLGECPICLSDEDLGDLSLSSSPCSAPVGLVMRCDACRAPFHRACVSRHLLSAAELGQAAQRCPVTGCRTGWPLALPAWALEGEPQQQARYDAAVGATAELQAAAAAAGESAPMTPRSVESFRRLGIRACPRCRACIQKQAEGLLSGCDKMTCRCGCMFCFKCGMEARAGGVARCRCVGMHHSFIPHSQVMGNYRIGGIMVGDQDHDLTKRKKNPATKQAVARLKRELGCFQKDPTPYIRIHCSESDILSWAFLIEGPADTPYSGGWYWGRMEVPSDYPFSPPLIRMLTPNGRFGNTDWLCRSLLDYHPDGWQPSWSVGALLLAVLSLMCEDAYSPGAIHPPTTDEERRRLAEESLAWNLQQADFRKAFPDVQAETRSSGQREPVERS